jgi:Ca2+-binding RTX toxin-like protein
VFAGCDIVGTRGNDTIGEVVSPGVFDDGVTDGPDVICGAGGADKIYGWNGNDVLYGDQPLPIADSSPIVNTAWINLDDDTETSPDPGEQLRTVAAIIEASVDGNDWREGGDGSDFLNGGAGNDQMWGGLGSDILLGGPGNDRMAGDVGNNPESTLGSPDHLNGGAGDDLLYGQGGDDGPASRPPNLIHNWIPIDPSYPAQIYGSSGVDRLHGGIGADQLDGGPEGGNSLVGGKTLQDYCSRGPGNNDPRDTSCELPLGLNTVDVKWESWGWSLP